MTQSETQKKMTKFACTYVNRW